MCGRFSLMASIDTLSQHFELSKGYVAKARYNISPGEMLPIIKNPGEVDFLRWGFVPRYQTVSETQKGFFNVRAETIGEKLSFRQAFLHQRCLVLADGFYEWTAVGKIKQPFYFRRKDEKPFAMAGIWEGETVAVITQAADLQLFKGHPRMPAVLTPETYAAWLAKKTPSAALKACLLAPSQDVFEVYPVSPQVNNTKYESPLCVRSL